MQTFFELILAIFAVIGWGTMVTIIDMKMRDRERKGRKKWK